MNSILGNKKVDDPPKIAGRYTKFFAIEPTAPNNPDISDNTFLPDNMLEKRYTFIKGYESSLAAPSGGASYDWTVKLPDVNDPEVIVEKSVCSEQIYNFFPERVFG